MHRNNSCNIKSILEYNNEFIKCHDMKLYFPYSIGTVFISFVSIVVGIILFLFIVATVCCCFCPCCLCYKCCKNRHHGRVYRSKN